MLLAIAKDDAFVIGIDCKIEAVVDMCKAHCDGQEVKHLYQSVSSILWKHIFRCIINSEDENSQVKETNDAVEYAKDVFLVLVPKVIFFR